MARVVERQIVSDAPTDKVFAYLADVTRHSEWAQPGHKLIVEKTSEGPIGQGSTFSSVGHQFGENQDAVTITEFVPNERVVYESEGGAGRFRHYFLLEEEAGGTRLTKGVEPVKLSLVLRFLLPIVRVFRVTARAFDGDLERIKEKLEAS